MKKERVLIILAIALAFIAAVAQSSSTPIGLAVMIAFLFAALILVRKAINLRIKHRSE